MSRPLSPSPTSGDLEEDLTIQKALLESLEDEEGSDTERRQIEEKIKSIEEQIAKMQPPLPNWGSSSNQHSNTDPRQNTSAVYPVNDNSTFYHDPSLLTPATVEMTLPSRKRPRNDFDDELDTLGVPGTKSLRTPTPRTTSPARSDDSFDTDLSDDPILRKLLGNDYNEEKRSTAQYLKDLEERRRQEEEDAEFARQLQETWNQSYPATNTSNTSAIPPVDYSQSFSQPYEPPDDAELARDLQEVWNTPYPLTTASNKSAKHPNNYSQSFLQPDGSFISGPVNRLPDSMVKPEANRQAPTVLHSGTSTPDSDDSGLIEISQNDWTGRFGSSQRRSLPSSMFNNNNNYNGNNLNVPGAFPGLNNNTFINTPGSSVYGNSSYNTSQYNSSTSSLGNFNFLKSLPFSSSFLPGSSQMPFDLDRYPIPPSLSYVDPEQTQEEIKELLKQIRPDEELTPQQLAEIQPDGLKINLMPHQRKGYAWMKSMEEGTNKGGILADDMGLGKTVQALALILGRPPALDKDGRRLQRPTLIVAPVALMQQWEREIKKMIHRSHRLNVLILHGSNRNASWNELRTYDVVLTTYGLLASDLKRKVLWDKQLKMVPDAQPAPQQRCPVLGERSKFHRVILDEAQNIKNKSTKAAAAACQVQADYRWCLSGTPMQNNVDEIYSLIKFCRIRPYHDYEKFSKDIGRPLKAKHAQYGREKAMQQLQALLRAILLRRTKKSEIDGQPILQLPDKHTVEDRTVFTKDELDFYKALETQAQIQFNRFLKNGTVGRHYSHALVLLLRLRQCCCSPQLVTNAKDFLVNGALQDLDYVENARHLPKEVIKRLSDLDAFECPICMDAVDNPVIFNPCGHSLCQECLSTMVDKAMADAESHKVSCPHCRAEIDTNKVTDHESFLRVHFPDRPGVKPLDTGDDNEGENEGTDTDSSDSDSSDDEIEDEDDDGEDLKDFVVPDDEDVQYDTDASESTKKKTVEKMDGKKDHKDFGTSSKSKSKSKSKTKQKHKAKGKKDKSKKRSKPDVKTLAQLRAEGLRSRAAKKKYLRRLGRGFQTSTKIEKTIEILKQVRDNGQGEKTIIFSSFTSFLDLLEVAMNRDEDDDFKIGNYMRYDGSMTAKDRNESVNRFTDDPNCKALLVSLKAGNAGLNLTAANHVVLLDPFWNPFVEYQAADRCYRIGQLKEVTIHRVLIGEGDEDGNVIEHPEGSEHEFTVEDRILRLQERKRELVETALDETASGNIGRLGTRELGYLFGVNSMDG